MAWFLAPSLVRLRREIDLAWPNRDRTTDGSIGDASHAASVSDHNPNSRGCVDAIDIDKDGINTYYVVGQAIKHPACNYVIWNRQIWSRSRGFAPVAYNGDSPHTDHIHVSIRQAVDAELSSVGWGISGGTTPTPSPVPSVPAYPGLLQRGSQGQGVRDLQARLNQRGYAAIAVDGDFGPATEDRVRKFQTFARITVDGQVGPVTWKLLWTTPIS